jgi:threonine dehydrogenase-like Zn-dependent dehydrogenase
MKALTWYGVGVIPEMKHGDVLGHEIMGEMVEVGTEVTNLKAGDGVVVPFTISCGKCFFFKCGFYSGCERSNPDRKKAETLWGHFSAGLFPDGLYGCRVEGPDLYKTFRDKKDGCIRLVLKP